jgi:hypothetical protein
VPVTKSADFGFALWRANGTAPATMATAAADEQREDPSGREHGRAT